jgi:hypothetical protein
MFFLFGLMMFGVCHGEETQAIRNITIYHDQVRTWFDNYGKGRDMIDITKSITHNPIQLLAVAKQYLKSPMEKDKRAAISLIVRVRDSEELRRYSLELLCDALSDPSNNIRRESGRLILESYEQRDFSDFSKALLKNALAKGLCENNLFRVCGMAHMTDVIDYFKEISKREPMVRRGAVFACAKMGDEDAIKEVLEMWKELSNETVEGLSSKDKDAALHRIQNTKHDFLKEIPYTRRNEFMCIFIEVINSNEGLPNVPPDEGLLAERALLVFKDYIVDFPKEIYAKDNRLDLFRQWLKQPRKLVFRK